MAKAPILSPLGSTQLHHRQCHSSIGQIQHDIGLMQGKFDMVSQENTSSTSGNEDSANLAHNMVLGPARRPSQEIY